MYNILYNNNRVDNINRFKSCLRDVRRAAKNNNIDISEVEKKLEEAKNLLELIKEHNLSYLQEEQLESQYKKIENKYNETCIR